MSLSRQRGSSLPLLLPCISLQSAFCYTAYLCTCAFCRVAYLYCPSAPVASVVPRTSIVPPHLRLLSCRVPLLCLRTFGFYCVAYLHCASVLWLLSRYVPPHWAFCYAAYPCTCIVDRLRTSTLSQWIACGPLIRTKLTVLLCATDSQIHRSDHAPERSRLHRFTSKFTFI